MSRHPKPFLFATALLLAACAKVGGDDDSAEGATLSPSSAAPSAAPVDAGAASYTPPPANSSAPSYGSAPAYDAGSSSGSSPRSDAGTKAASDGGVDLVGEAVNIISGLTGDGGLFGN